MRVCCVPGCTAGNKQGLDLKYFKFPKSKTVRRAWLRVVKRTLKQAGASLVCSSHFTETDYTVVNGRRTLKKTSVPSLTIHCGDPKLNNIKGRHTSSSKEEESTDTDESTSDKEVCTKITNNTEIVADKKSFTGVLLNTKLRLDSVETDGSCEKSETIISDVLVKDVFSDVVERDEVTGAKVDKCKSAGPPESGAEVAVDGDKASELDACLRRSTDSDHTQPDTNGCDPTADPLSCQNGDPSPPTPPEPHTRPPASKTPPIDPENPPPTPAKPLDPDKTLTDIETLLDSENPPAVIANPSEQPHQGVEMTVLDPKTGLMRSGSVESIPDSCESLDESTEERLKLAEPVFVEISVDPAGIGTPSPPDSPTDCMMIVENVQVDIDPSMLLMNEPEEEGLPVPDDDSNDDDVQVLDKKPEEPVSLLTSSDEDDVILQEPHIDCVSVSDETDEDDQPLTRLLKNARKKQEQVKKVTDILERRLKDIFWGKSNEFYCYLCTFSTKSKSALALHAQKHVAPGQAPPALSFNVCSLCSFQTPSRTQFSRHTRKHKEDKRYQCRMCEYKARHKMSLVYHVKATHMSALDGGDVDPDVERVATSRRPKVKDKKRSPKLKKRSPDTKRRRTRKDDDDYEPGAEV